MPASLKYLVTLCFCLAGSIAGYAQSVKAKKINLEDKIVDKIFNLPEVKARMRYVDSASKNSRHLSVFIEQTPNRASDYYWVKVWESNGYSFVTHFHFFVNPHTLEIKYLDTANDTLLSLKAWRMKKRPLQ